MFHQIPSIVNLFRLLFWLLFWWKTTSTCFLNPYFRSTVMNQGCKPVNSTNVFTTRKQTLILQNYRLRKWPIVITGENDPPFLLPTPPHLRLPSVPMSAEACWRPKIPTDVTSNVLPVYRSAYECRRQGKDREDIQQTCPKETRKEQYYTTKCISSISCIDRMLLIATCIIFYLRGEQEKGCTQGQSLEMLVMFWWQ